MPINPRVRGNNSFGLTTDNPLTAGALIFNSAGLVTFPIVATQHAIVTLDPLRQFGEPEIVIVTIHTSLATSATITRGAYGTVARSHPINTLWLHAPLNEDFISIVTAGTRPTDPYEGQFIYELDTNKLYGYGGVDWAPRDAGGQLNYAQVVVNQATITAEVDLTGLSVAVTVGTGRRIKISHRSLWISTASFTVRTAIKEGATQFNEFQAHSSIIGNGCSTASEAILTPSAGVHTYKIAGTVFGGTGTMLASATFPAYILVEDIGAA